MHYGYDFKGMLSLS